MAQPETQDRRGAAKGEWGNAPHIPTADTRQNVMAYAAVGLTVGQMAELMHVSNDTIQRHYSEELANGRPLANAKVAAKLFQKAMTGDTVSMLFWLKTQAGWVEPRAPLPIMPTTPDEGPINRADQSMKIEFVTPPALPAPKP